MAALGNHQESPPAPHPVSLSSPRTPGAHHHEALLHLHDHQHGTSPCCQPQLEGELSDLDPQDVQEVEIGRNTCWPDTVSEPEKVPPSPQPDVPQVEVGQDTGVLKSLLRALPRRPMCGDSFGPEASLDRPTGQPPGAGPCTQKRVAWRMRLLPQGAPETGGGPELGSGFSLGAGFGARQGGAQGGKPHRCETCGKSFKYNSLLVKHQRTLIQTGEKSCTICGKLFGRSSGCPEHQRNHSTRARGPFRCTECGRPFGLSSHLIQHQQVHTPERPYPCGSCGRSFACRSDAAKHQSIHRGQKPYACSDCGKAFIHSSHVVRHQRSFLREHRRIHTGEKPYECGVCGRTFRALSGFFRHQRVHTGEKPFRCTECGRAFGLSSHLIQHQRVHSPK
uniref:GLI family zinc finger 4 n=1 Tax=Loxodonta africana TaxID=9785 RepID=G3TNB2_LOXAF